MERLAHFSKLCLEGQRTQSRVLQRVTVNRCRGKSAWGRIRWAGLQSGEGGSGRVGPHRKGPRHGDVGDGHLSSEEVHSQRQNGHALTNLLSRGSLPRPEGIRSLLVPPKPLGAGAPFADRQFQCQGWGAAPEAPPRPAAGVPGTSRLKSCSRLASYRSWDPLSHVVLAPDRGPGNPPPSLSPV